ncbi:class I SAM-dependent methyltransferase [Candidatus Halocynthiibacter alkanivorans]|uniref:class I SAM-dependent methyltransferase n=1 Tax=Candidatus Halocynthiibacter alkanivorans TaxID=2267619 RepID=UPI000DF17AE7|nr:class I SAM-dependent methyltransferase [Candidatus Halocynthiibacter alkanivorans]
MESTSHCPVCDAVDPKPVFALRDVPVLCNQLWPDATAARAAACGDVELVRCKHCAMIWNRAFDAARMVYAPGYENALHFSPRFQSFAEDLAAGLVTRHDLAGRHVVEIGCGDGHILDLLAKNGVATATGFDPSMAGKDSPFSAREGVAIIPEYFHADHLERPFDAVICRHVLEHLDQPAALLHQIRAAIGNRDVLVYFEVPNAGWMLDTVSMWDVIYEHVGYWSAAPLSTMFRRAGLEPVSVATGYDRQFLMIEARAGAPQPHFLSNTGGEGGDVRQERRRGDSANAAISSGPTRPASRTRPGGYAAHARTDGTAEGTGGIARAADIFAEVANGELERWKTRLAGLRGRAVIWGAGSKGITFANALGEAGVSLAALIDLNPRKHGLFAPGVALPVLAPTALSSLRPDLVLISNALYRGEITTRLNAMGLAPDIEVIAG